MDIAYNMRTKSITDIQAQTERIRSAGSWRRLRERWDYDKFMALCRKIDTISTRYISTIGQYQREVEGMTKVQQSREWIETIHRQYPIDIYAKIQTHPAHPLQEGRES